MPQGWTHRTILWVLPCSSRNIPYSGEAERSQIVLGKNMRGSYCIIANLSDFQIKIVIKALAG